MRVFILEDDPNRREAFAMALETVEVCHVAIDVEEALRKWAPPYDIVLLDHDLGGEQIVDSHEPNTGYQFVKKAPAMNRCVSVVVHSWNPTGATAMYEHLRDCGVNATRHPFDRALLAWLRDLAEECVKGRS